MKSWGWGPHDEISAPVRRGKEVNFCLSHPIYGDVVTPWANQNTSFTLSTKTPWKIASSGSSLLFGRLTLSAQRPGEDFPISPHYFLPDILFEQVFALMYKSSHGKVYGISSTLLFPFIPSQPFRWQFQAYFLKGIFPDGFFHFNLSIF